jgi:peptidoglycan-N-acetylglucosamine deacetylase
MRVAAVCLLGFVWLSTAAAATECPANPTALGVSRVISVDPAEHARIGTMQYRETLPLEPGEVVITFDDGPLPPNTNRILETLASECVKATYFLVGQMAQAHPEMVRRIHDAGHTIGTHSLDHPLTFHRMSIDKVRYQIDGGVAAVKAALASPDQLAPFFRIPGLLRAEDVESYLADRSIMTWSADFPADDWKRRVGAAEIAKRAMSRLDAKGKGVLLLHDIHAASAQALPILLHELKAKGYRVVHIVPASAEHPKTATVPSQWLMKPPRDPVVASTWPDAITVLPESAATPRLPAPGQHVFGFGRPFEFAAVDSPADRASSAARVAAPSSWPRPARSPSILDLVSREELPAPNPESFRHSGLPVDLLHPLSQRRAAAPSSAASAEVQTVAAATSVARRFGQWPSTTGAGPKAGFP